MSLPIKIHGPGPSEEAATNEVEEVFVCLPFAMDPSGVDGVPFMSLRCFKCIFVSLIRFNRVWVVGVTKILSFYPCHIDVSSLPLLKARSLDKSPTLKQPS